MPEDKAAAGPAAGLSCPASPSVLPSHLPSAVAFLPQTHPLGSTSWQMVKPSVLCPCQSFIPLVTGGPVRGVTGGG